MENINTLEEQRLEVQYAVASNLEDIIGEFIEEIDVSDIIYEFCKYFTININS